MTGGSVVHAATVTGIVRDQDGVAMSNALVTFTGEGGQGQSVSTTTGVDGRYELSLTDQTLVAAPAAGEIPSSHALYQNYPNPFNPAPIIPYGVARVTDVRLDIYNALGQRVRTLVEGPRTPGLYRVRWNAADDQGQGVAAGIYFYRFVAGDYAQSGKMVLIDGSHRVVGGVGGLSVIGEPAAPARKTLAVAPFYTVTVTGEGFAPYERTGVAVEGDTQIDVLVNSAEDMGMVRLGLTDAPVDSADAVRVTVSTVEIRRGSNDPWQTFAGEPRTFDLLALTGGVTELLGEQVLPPGELTGVRLIVDSAEIDVEAGTFPLFVPSGTETGLKLEGSFEVVPGETLDLTLDFDVRQSVVKRGRENDFLLQPVVRLVETGESGFIAGSLVLAGGVTVEEYDAVVIAYQGSDEVTSARVDEEDGTFRLSYLPPGAYDLRVEKGEGLSLDPERIDGVEVTANAGTEVAFTVTGPAGGNEGDEGDEPVEEEGDEPVEEGEEDEGEALSIGNAEDAWDEALGLLARLVEEAGEDGESVVSGEVAGEAMVTRSVSADGVKYAIVLEAMSDDGELVLSGDVVITTDDGQEFIYTGGLVFDGSFVGEMSLEMSGTIDDTSGTLTVGDEEVIVE